MKLDFTIFLRVYGPLLDLRGIWSIHICLFSSVQSNLQKTLLNRNLQNCETFLFQVAS